MMGKVLSFGELLLRISPDGEGHWLEENRLPFYIGGAEANVAAALALWNIPVAYVSALPDNYLARDIVGYLSNLGIDVSFMQYTGERIGIYYLAQGKDFKISGVIYDRANSSFATLQPGKLDWERILKDVSWLHFSAICPALNPDTAIICREALKEATARGIFCSIDLNYRAKLWKYGVEPIEVMPALVAQCDLVMGNIWAAERMLGIEVPDKVVEQDSKEGYTTQAAITSAAIMEKYPKCKTVANTFRFEEKGAIRYYTTLYEAGELHVSKEYNSDRVINKIGSGDCFMAGLIYAKLQKMNASETVAFATAAAYAKLFVESDFSTASVDEIENILKSHDIREGYGD